MARSNEFPRVLWMLTSAWLAGCGRVGFDARGDNPGSALADAADIDSPVIVGPAIDAANVDGPNIDAAPAPPVLTVVTPPAGMSTTCAGTIASGTLVVGNSGGSDLVITNITIAAGGDAFGVVPTSRTIAPGATGSFTISPPAATLGTDIGGKLKRATLMIESNSGGKTLAITALIIGANLEITSLAPPPPPQQLVLNGTSGSCPVPAEVTITNRGNRPFTVAVQTSAAFSMSGFSGGAVGSGASMTTSVGVLTSGACSGQGSVQYQINNTANNCGASALTVLPASFTITGASASCICP